MKPRVFIGSSSEAIPRLHVLRDRLCQSYDVAPWDDIFEAGCYTTEGLLRTVRQCQVAAFLFTPDDVVELRGKPQPTTRDNVLFELGLFMGHLGPRSCFAVTPRDCPDFRIASDLLGLTTLRFNAQSTPDDPQDMISVADDIARRIQALCQGEPTQTSLTGGWSQTWKVASEAFPCDNESQAELLQVGDRVHGRWESSGRTYVLVGERKDRILTGQWYDVEEGGTYFGAFQLKVHPMQEDMDGVWLGFSTSEAIKTGQWVWRRVPRGAA